jgi:hypothetical protein
MKAKKVLLPVEAADIILLGYKGLIKISLPNTQNQNQNIIISTLTPQLILDKVTGNFT